MNKVVCNVCGTSYPENAAQCPICGFAHTPEKSIEDGSNTSYTYVKGGRFSKANVRKRTHESHHTDVAANSTTKAAPKAAKKKNGVVAGILIVILLLAILAVVGYIVLRFFVPNDFLYAGMDGFTTPAVTQNVEVEAETETTVVDTNSKDIACINIKVEQFELIFEEIGSSAALNFTLEPTDATEEVTFTSSDESVAIVDSTGIVTVTGEGTAIITISCGKTSARIPVSCILPIPATEEEPAVTLMLNRMEITFDAEGQSWMLYDGNIALSSIIWSSDDNSVATISDGKVIAVGNGNTVVYGSYEGQIVSCIIHCNFNAEEISTGNGGISEAGGDTQRVCKLYNPYGNSDDVTLQVNEQFTLKLVDENTNAISGATWSIQDESICSYDDGIVTALKSGTTEVTATFEGVAYSCIVRVN